MTSYYEDRSKDIKGCINGAYNDTLTGPRDMNQAKCKIYKEHNQTYMDSCYNQKMLNEARCFGNNCSKQLIQPIPNAPVLIGIGFTDSMGMYKMSYTRKSIEDYLRVVWPQWKNSWLDLSKNINVAEVAKAYYIDRTMDQSQVQF